MTKYALMFIVGMLIIAALLSALGSYWTLTVLAIVALGGVAALARALFRRPARDDSERLREDAFDAGRERTAFVRDFLSSDDERGRGGVLHGEDRDGGHT